VLVEREVVSAVSPGDLVDLDDGLGWRLVEAVSTGDVDGVLTLTLRALTDDERRLHHVRVDTIVRRGEPDVVHQAAVFIGMPVAHAEAWAASLGWAFRNLSVAAFMTDDWRHDRVNVWTDHDGTVVRAELY
jgi:hypothetical protein